MSNWLKAAIVAGIAAGTMVASTAIQTEPAGHTQVTSGPAGGCVVLRISTP